MMKMVRKHLSEKYVIQEEDLLERIAESSEKGRQCHVLVKGCHNHMLHLVSYPDAEKPSQSTPQGQEEISARKIQ